MLLNMKTVKVLTVLGICSLLGYIAILVLLGVLIKYL